MNLAARLARLWDRVRGGLSHPDFRTLSEQGVLGERLSGARLTDRECGRLLSWAFAELRTGEHPNRVLDLLETLGPLDGPPDEELTHQGALFASLTRALEPTPSLTVNHLEGFLNGTVEAHARRYLFVVRGALALWPAWRAGAAHAALIAARPEGRRDPALRALLWPFEGALAGRLWALAAPCLTADELVRAVRRVLVEAPASVAELLARAPSGALAGLEGPLAARCLRELDRPGREAVVCALGRAA